MKRIIFLAGLLTCFAGLAFAQPRPADKTPPPAAAIRQAPPSFEAKYEGGMFGYSRKESGTLKFDDANSRLVFYGKDKSEKFHIPYKSLLVVSPQSRSVRSTTGTVISVIPLPGAGLAGFMREKRRYLVINFDDPDAAGAHGVMSFKLDNKELLDSVIQTLGEKAKMTQRGDAYYRPRIVKTDI
jgi:hypothetical protein